MAVGDKDVIRFGDTFDRIPLFFYERIKRVVQPGIDQDDLPRRCGNFKSGMTMPSQRRPFCGRHRDDDRAHMTAAATNIAIRFMPTSEKDNGDGGLVHHPHSECMS